MNNKNKGLADNYDGDIILNESGTSLTYDKVDESVEPPEPKEDTLNTTKPEKQDPGVGHA